MFELDGHEDGSITPCTRDGSVDCHGKPAIKDRTGGWRSAILLLGIHASLDIHVVVGLKDSI